MSSSAKVVQRIEQRVTELSRGFVAHLDYFEATQLFTGPSLYFHRKAIARRRDHASIAAVLDDDLFLEYLYATLTAWGLHRMGPGNTKLQDLDVIQHSLKAHAQGIEDLGSLSITSIDPRDAARVARELWLLIASLQVSIAEARIVANSKTLHHLLPDLVPPMDREYTFNFFYDRNMLSISEERAFIEMFTPLCGIAHRNAGNIRSRLGAGWHTGEAKVVDNALVGYMLARRAEALSNPRLQRTGA